MRAALIVLITVLIGAALTLPAMAAPLGRVAGHRGATGVSGVPEESLKSIQYVKKYGGTVAEGDVQFTKDDYAVMLHDKTLDRVSNCKGKVADKTFAQIRKCASDKQVPQLLFWLREVKRQNLTALIEVKYPMTAHQLEVLRRTVVNEAPKNTVIASFHESALMDSKRVLGNRIEVAPIIHDRNRPNGKVVESPFGYNVNEHAKKWNIIIAEFSWLIVARVGWYHDRGVQVWGYTASSAADVRRCKALKLDVIIADDVRKVTGK